MKAVIISDQNEIPLILSVQTANASKKRIDVIAPRLPLPWGYGSVDVFSAENGVQIREANSPRTLCDLPCDIEEVERLWTYLLPLFSRAYIAGDSDARDGFASAITTLFNN